MNAKRFATSFCLPKAIPKKSKDKRNMKRVFIFTLTMLFATTCLFLTSLTAEIDYDSGHIWAGNAWGEAYVSTWFESPNAKSSHWVSLGNYSTVQLRYYYGLESDVDGPTDKFPKVKEDDGWVERNMWWSTSRSHSFNMSGARDGWYTIYGSSDLDVKADFNRDGDFDAFDGWNASCSTRFRIE